MQLTGESVRALAPDASSAAAGKKLANARHWKSLGQNAEALWGECQGSALYQVQVDLVSLSCKCSCPSHKFPCKHSLGLLLIAADVPSSVPAGEPPDWVAAWLAKRKTSGEQKQAKAAKEAKKAPEDVEKERAKRAEKRLALVGQGLDNLDLWLSDLVRNGLAAVETQPSGFWEGQAARLVDAQAPGVAARVRRLAEIPGSAPDWPEALLSQLGRIALLTHAFRRLDQLVPALQEDVRQQIGWTLTQEEVAARGETVGDEWLALGRWVEPEDRVRTQRTWLLGARTGRTALVLQFSPAGAPFGEMLPPGARQTADLTFWPGALPLRARIAARHGEMAPLSGRFPGAAGSIEAFLAGVAEALARQPWLDRFLCVLGDAVPVYETSGEHWSVRDGTGATLPLLGGPHWRLLALSGGGPVDLAGEWDGAALRPLGVMADGVYYSLAEGS